MISAGYTPNGSVNPSDVPSILAKYYTNKINPVTGMYWTYSEIAQQLGLPEDAVRAYGYALQSSAGDLFKKTGQAVNPADAAAYLPIYASQTYSQPGTQFNIGGYTPQNLPGLMPQNQPTLGALNQLGQLLNTGATPVQTALNELTRLGSQNAGMYTQTNQSTMQNLIPQRRANQYQFPWAYTPIRQGKRSTLRSLFWGNNAGGIY